MPTGQYALTDAKPIGAYSLADAQPAADFSSENEKDASGHAVVDPNTVGTLIRHWWDNASPVNLGQLLPFPKALGGSGLDHPLAPGPATEQYAPTFLRQMHAVKQQGDAAWDKGDKVTAAAKYVESILPIIGPWMSQVGDRAQAGKGMAVAGDALGMATAIATPALIKGGLKLAASGGGPKLTPEEVASNDFARQEGIPLDAATATGSRTLRAAEKRVANSLGGEGTADRLITAQQQALQASGDRLAQQTAPMPATPETGGTAVQSALQRVVEGHDARANAAYQRAETLIDQLKPQTRSVTPGQPVQSMRVPVDVRAVKAGIQPLYEALKREAALVPLQGGKARALVAMDRLMNGPDFAPLLDAERASSDLGALAGSPDVMRTPGQANAAQAFGQLRNAVNKAAAQASPRVLAALEEGRAATKAKYTVHDVADSLREEPVQTYRQLTAPKDTNINLLRQVAQHAQGAIPDVARGYLEQLLDQATERGRFDHADKLYAEWQKLGDATKQTLFPDAAHRAALDRFFLLAKRLGENPNPSGTAHTLTALNFGSIPVTWGLSKLLYTSEGVNALTKLLTQTSGRASSVGSVATQPAAVAQLVGAARAAGVPVTWPKAADQETAEPR